MLGPYLELALRHRHPPAQEPSGTAAQQRADLMLGGRGKDRTGGEARWPG